MESVVFIGESYNGSITVSKTVHGGSNPSSPVSEKPEKMIKGFLFCKKYVIIFVKWDIPLAE